MRYRLYTIKQLTVLINLQNKVVAVPGKLLSSVNFYPLYRTQSTLSVKQLRSNIEKVNKLNFFIKTN